MNGNRFLFTIIIVFLTLGCATPRLGFPEKTMEIPVPVTLFTDVADTGVLDNRLPMGSKDVWELLYREHMVTLLGKINSGEIQMLINPEFVDKAKKTDLFIVDPDFVVRLNAEYTKSEQDTSAFSGYNFSDFQASIPAKYILAFTVDQWGYTVSNTPTEDGPFMVFCIRLIDKESNESVWEYSKRYHTVISSALKGTRREVLDPVDLEGAYKKLVSKALKDFFIWLNSK
ncbi:MAG: hypothetical protein JW904_09670 [Spirochaetales bacterium]|nr:hypothetical protein [Spirochaetales bacterium]